MGRPGKRIPKLAAVLKRPSCARCKDTGIIPEPKGSRPRRVKTALGLLDVDGAGGAVCGCEAGKRFHEAWQGLVSPGN